MAIGRWREAQEQFEAVAARHPRSIYAQTMVAALLQAQSKGPDARRRTEKVLALDPNAAIAANNLAWEYVESGASLDVALRLARLAASQLGDRPETNDTLGWIYCASGRSRDAIPLLEKSVRLDPSRAVYHYHLGVAYQRVGEPTLARHSFQRALLRNPKLEDARHGLAAVTPMATTSPDSQ